MLSIRNFDCSTTTLKAAKTITSTGQTCLTSYLDGINNENCNETKIINLIR
jgi:hypothetical protein